MNFESIRPLLSGLAGGKIAIFVCRAIARWVPEVCNGKGADALIQENRVGIWFANTFFFVGILVAIAIYQMGFLANDDWRGGALGVGAGSLIALILLPLPTLWRGNSPKEAYVAYAISQKTPIVLLYGIFVMCVFFFTVAVADLFVF